MKIPPLFSILGPTASGKTGFAVQLAGWLREKGWSIDVIVADSRQVYKGMEIGTGVDLPAPQEGIRWFGYSLIQPDEAWSLGHFWRYARPIIDEAVAAKRAVIVVGGTGLYHRQLWRDQITDMAGADEEVRAQAATLSLIELQAWVQKVDATGFFRLTPDDKANPRRLVRVIERAEQRVELPKNITELRHFTIALTAPIEWLESRITQRVHDRLAAGVVREVVALLAAYPDRTLSAWSATGYQELAEYLAGSCTEEEAMKNWIRAERAYAKRQLTWLKREHVDLRLDVTQPEWQAYGLAEIVQRVKTD